MRGRYRFQTRIALMLLTASIVGAASAVGASAASDGGASRDCGSTGAGEHGSMAAPGTMMQARSSSDCGRTARAGEPVPVAVADTKPLAELTALPLGIVGMRSVAPHPSSELRDAQPAALPLPDVDVDEASARPPAGASDNGRAVSTAPVADPHPAPVATQRATVTRAVEPRRSRGRLLSRASARRSSPRARATTDPASQPDVQAPPDPRDDDALKSAAATLGPTAQVGRRVWVQVATDGEVRAERAVSIGTLLGDDRREAALNCWGQPVLFVGQNQAGQDQAQWSRSMVCDGKPASDNEWSAQIHYGAAAGSATR